MASLLPSGIITAMEELLMSIEIRSQKIAQQLQSMDLHYQKMGAGFNKVLEILEKEEMESDLTDPAPILTDKMEDDALGGSVPPESATSAMKLEIASATSELGVDSTGSQQLKLREVGDGFGKISSVSRSHGSGQISGGLLVTNLDRAFSRLFVLTTTRLTEDSLDCDKPPPWPPPSTMKLEIASATSELGHHLRRGTRQINNSLMAAKLDRTFPCFNIHQWILTASNAKPTEFDIDWLTKLDEEKPPPWPPPSTTAKERRWRAPEKQNDAVELGAVACASIHQRNVSTATLMRRVVLDGRRVRAMAPSMREGSGVATRYNQNVF